MINVLRIRDLEKAVNLSESTIRRLMADDSMRFPKSFLLTKSIQAWDGDDVAKWLDWRAKCGKDCGDNSTEL